MRLAILLAISVLPVAAQTAVQQQIRAAALAAHGKVSVACSLPQSQLNCDLDPHAHPPMQSVFKLPLAIVALHQVEQGKFSLDMPVRFRPEDRIPHAYSPLQDKYPDANTDVPLRELLRLSVSLSDNVAADIVLRKIGGAEAANAYIASLGVRGFHLRDGEAALHRDKPLQYRNWFEPAGAVALLRRIADTSPLTPEHTALLIDWMKTSRLSTRLSGDLPAGTPVAHKSGTSDVDNGLAAATNDIGLITLPDGRQLAIAVFVTDSTADERIRDEAIATIVRVAYDAAVAQRENAEGYV
ncbi:class A beta-lactamase [Acidicapsa dinghuensis]|uniref:beta-lactamase n=1 Tax=Acidicapsa dinghuensis TaxID=2218256 RepID=A0ABW1E9H9_9BACT|nr:class A beta-lactamase [Acidicapsa dinghuensis]